MFSNPALLQNAPLTKGLKTKKSRFTKTIPQNFGHQGGWDSDMTCHSKLHSKTQLDLEYTSSFGKVKQRSLQTHPHDPCRVWQRVKKCPIHP
jgi:hypothetical protein